MREESEKKKTERGVLSIKFLRDELAYMLSSLEKKNKNARGLAHEFYRKYWDTDFNIEYAFDSLIMDMMNVESGEGLPGRTAELVQRFLVTNFTLEEVESVSNENRGEYPTDLDFVLNETFYVTQEEDVFDLHVLAMASKPVTEQFELMQDAFRELASRLATNPKYFECTQIHAVSWLVIQIPQFFTERGFELDPEKKGNASITKEKFIELHLNKTES